MFEIYIFNDKVLDRVESHDDEQIALANLSAARCNHWHAELYHNGKVIGRQVTVH